MNDPRPSALQLRILSLIAQGYSTKEIARHLGYKPRSIQNRLTEILPYYGAKNRTQAVLAALAAGDINPLPRRL